MFNKFLTAKNVFLIILIVSVMVLIPQVVGVILLFFASYVIAAALKPAVDKLSKKIKRAFAAALVVFALLTSIVALFLPIIIIALREIKFIMAILPEKIALISNYIMTQQFKGQNISEIVDMHSILGNSTEIAQNVLSHSINFTSEFAQVCVLSVATTIIVFYLLLDWEYLHSKLIEFFPKRYKEKAKHIFKTITLKVGSYFRTQILSMVWVGVMVMIVLAMLGINYSLLLGLISGLLDIIPIVGPSIALIAILLVAGHYGVIKVALVVVGFLLVQILSNYAVRPFLFGKFMQLHPLMIFLALFLSQQFLGLWGVILSPAIAATACVLVDELYLIPINKGVISEQK